MSSRYTPYVKGLVDAATNEVWDLCYDEAPAVWEVERVLKQLVEDVLAAAP